MTNAPFGSARVAEFVARPRPMLIGGNWVMGAAGETIDVVNPATAQVFAHVAKSDRTDVDAAVAAARKAFDFGPWPKMLGSERARLLWRIAELIAAHGDELAELDTLDNGRPYAHARAIDVPRAAAGFHYYAGWCDKIKGEAYPLSLPGEFLAYTRQEPIGVAAQIIPWNFPLVQAAWKLAPALAAGCTIVLKPAEQTPLSALRLGELILEAGVPEGVVNIIPGYGYEAGAALAAHPGVDKISFTGSTDTGRAIIAASAGNLKKVSLELGGKSATMVLADADLDAAIRGAARSIFANSGQVCMAGSRLLVERKVFNQVVEGIADIARKLHVAPGIDPKCEMGPLVSERQRDRVGAMVDAAVAQGVDVVAGGTQIAAPGYFYTPTVLAGATSDMPIVREEVFGPVLVATAVDDLDEMAAAANDSVFGLAGCIWTRDISRAHKLAARVRTGLLWINGNGATDMNVLVGGFKQSGWGRENGLRGLESYQETKTIVTVL